MVRRSKDTLLVNVGNSFGDNITGDITPSHLRSWLTDAIDSFDHVDDVNVQTITANTVITADSARRWRVNSANSGFDLQFDATTEVAHTRFVIMNVSNEHFFEVTDSAGLLLHTLEAGQSYEFMYTGSAWLSFPHGSAFGILPQIRTGGGTLNLNNTAAYRPLNQRLIFFTGTTPLTINFNNDPESAFVCEVYNNGTVNVTIGGSVPNDIVFKPGEYGRVVRQPGVSQDFLVFKLIGRKTMQVHYDAQVSNNAFADFYFSLQFPITGRIFRCSTINDTVNGTGGSFDLVVNGVNAMTNIDVPDTLQATGTASVFVQSGQSVIFRLRADAGIENGFIGAGFAEIEYVEELAA